MFVRIYNLTKVLKNTFKVSSFRTGELLPNAQQA